MRHRTKIFIAAALGLALPTAAQSMTADVIGAWASGDTVEAGDTAPITHFMSDGVVAVFLTKDGALHALGSWSVEDAQLTMTHNDFPLNGDGVSKTPVALDILTLDETRFVTRNAEGRERARIRCEDIEITMGREEHAH